MMFRNLKTQLLFSNKRTPVVYQKTTGSIKKRRCYATITREGGSGSDSDDEDHFNQRKQPEDPTQMHPEKLQTIRALNKMFYYDYTLSYQELKDLIIGTFKKLYRIKLEVREKQICFVVYPEVKSEDDLEYKKEMDIIAMVLTDYAMKEYLYDELKKVTVFQRGVIVIPLHIDLQQN
jgi:hypothetical protein